MTNYAVGSVKSNKQNAGAYIAYMMVGSHFLDARMEQRMLEQRLRMDYLLLPSQRQAEMEARIDNMINSMDRAKWGDLKCRVHLRTISCGKDGEVTCLWFETGFEEILVIVDENARFFVEKTWRLTEKRWKSLKVEAVKTKDEDKVIKYVFEKSFYQMCQGHQEHIA